MQPSLVVLIWVSSRVIFKYLTVGTEQASANQEGTGHKPPAPQSCLHVSLVYGAHFRRRGKLLQPRIIYRLSLGAWGSISTGGLCFLLCLWGWVGGGRPDSLMFLCTCTSRLYQPGSTVPQNNPGCKVRFKRTQIFVDHLCFCRAKPRRG